VREGERERGVRAGVTDAAIRRTPQPGLRHVQRLDRHHQVHVPIVPNSPAPGCSKVVRSWRGQLASRSLGVAVDDYAAGL
jgi:hypothetical protein